ncbi:MAG: hypothetical protein R8G66_23555 [Cytophagales bacterium]|nr:hypothetical protein [Cytophagales bacterium]
MNRRDFTAKSLASSALLATLPLSELFGSNLPSGELPVLSYDQINPETKDQFKTTLDWMRNNGWNGFLKNELKINIDLSSNISLDSLQKPLADIKQLRTIKGLEDFSGQQLIQPGIPEESLLYHLMASPRVKSLLIKSYPEIGELEALENYIYSFVDLDRYPFQNKDNVFLTVLSYEYRPGLKTPPYYQNYLDRSKASRMVFSRCGVARIGTDPLNYDAENRLFTNEPKAANKNNVAVTAARYGLFLVELVDAKDSRIKIMNRQKEEAKGKSPRRFVCPIAKITDTDAYQIEYGHHHINEKLYRLSQYRYQDRAIEFNKDLDLEKEPFIRVDSSEPTLQKNDQPMVDTMAVGSSILVTSIPDELIRFAYQDGKLLSVPVPEGWAKRMHSNRRHSAMKLPNEYGKEVTNVIISDVIYRRSRRVTSLRSPKIAPLFLNIKFEADESAQSGYKHIDGETYPGTGFEDKIQKGGYQTIIFEDSICDGCVAAKLVSKNNSLSGILEEKSNQVLPAFSLVTAPDFFPYIDSNDIRASYKPGRGVNTDQDFFEGGTMNLSGIRQRGNPALRNPFNPTEPAFASTLEENKSHDTLTVVVSSGKNMDDTTNQPIQNFERNFLTSSFLPDTGTGVFFPGWDVTYSAEPGKVKSQSPYIATYGLGSPFPEDMKLCAAANGMWPVTSPDAGRTFQGSLEAFPIVNLKPNTAIPLMDQEIGIHPNSPAVKTHRQSPNYGWDGEQGPFVEWRQNNLQVNYTDIGRADYLLNLLDDNIGFDMSQLRNLEGQEVVRRMDCLRKTIKKVDHKKLWSTKLWLINAVKVDDWSKPFDPKCLPNEGIFSQIDYKTPQNDMLSGKGYFFVIAKTGKGESQNIGDLDDTDEDKKRLMLPVKKMWICQITTGALAFTQIKKDQKKPGKWKREVWYVPNKEKENSQA